MAAPLSLSPPRALEQHAELAPLAESWGWVPGLSLLGAFAVLIVAIAVDGARVGSPWAEPLFWMGLLGLFGPFAWRLAVAQPSPRERLGLVVLLGLGLYLVKVLEVPSVTRYDELLHWRTANDILTSGHLFSENPLLPVSPYFPGLELSTAALASLAGLPILTAGHLVVGAARLVLVVALYLLYVAASGSPRAAGIGALLYMGNPGFVFFDASFAYESLALPLCLLAAYAVARRARQPRGRQLELTAVLLLILGAAISTHHVSSYALVAFLLLWTLSSRVVRSGGEQPGVMGATTLVALVLALAWLAYVASLAVGYLAPNLLGGVYELTRLMAGQPAGRPLFINSAGQVAPLWDRALGYASTVSTLLVLPVGLLRVWRRHRDDALAVALAVGALAYPVSLMLRLTQTGAEVSSRSSEFVFVALGFVVGVGAVESWPAWQTVWRPYVVATAATVIFAGGVILGVPAWARLPGPYLVAADTRSIETQGVSAALWARSFLGPGNRIAADRVNRLLMGSYGEQRVVTAYGDRVDVPELFFAPELGVIERDVLQLGQIHYVLVDRRLSTALPLVGAYFDLGECHELCPYPVPSQSLDKFEHLEWVPRVFDSGDIVIYEVGKPISVTSDVTSSPTTTTPPSGTQLAEPGGSGWQTWYQDPQGSAWPSSDGGYHLLVQQPEHFVAVGAPLPSPVTDVVVRATFRKLGGPPGAGYGLIVRDQQRGPRESGSQKSSYYLLAVSDAGAVGMWRREGGRWQDVQPWTPTPAVLSGEGANQLEVEASGPRLTMRVNGTNVANWEQSLALAGGVGAYVGGGAGTEVRLEDFFVEVPK